MKNKLIISNLILALIFITSCSESNDKNVKNTKTPVFEEKKVETKLENGVLTIGNNTKVKKGKASDFPSDFPIITGGEIYQNSNMQQYAFFIEKDKSLQNIYDFYKKELENKGYKDNTIVQKDKKIEELSHILLIFTKGDEKITIGVNKEVPKVLKENIKLEGNFIEIYISKIEK